MTPLTKPVTRAGLEPLGKKFGGDSDRPIVVTLLPGDRIRLRPKGRRTGDVTLDLDLVYRYGLIIGAATRRLERANRAKERKARARLARAEKQLFTKTPIQD